MALTLSGVPAQQLLCALHLAAVDVVGVILAYVVLEKARKIAAAQVAERCHFVHGYHLVQVLFYVYDGGVYHAAFLHGLFRADVLLRAGKRVYLHRGVGRRQAGASPGRLLSRHS